MTKISIALLLLVFSGLAIGSKNCTTFTVDNLSSQSIGDVYVTGSNQWLDIIVGNQGRYSGTICFNPTAATINGQSSTYPTGGTVLLVNGAKVAVSWTGTDEIAVKDIVVQNSPMR